MFEIDEDVEGMQSTIYYLQQQLKEAKEQIVQLQQENDRLANQRPHGETTANKPNQTSDAQVGASPKDESIKQEEEDGEVCRATTLDETTPSNGIDKIKVEENGTTNDVILNEIEPAKDLPRFEKAEETQATPEINQSAESPKSIHKEVAMETLHNNGNHHTSTDWSDKKCDESLPSPLSDISSTETSRKRSLSQPETEPPKIGGGIDSIIRKHRRLESVSEDSTSRTTTETS